MISWDTNTALGWIIGTGFFIYVSVVEYLDWAGRMEYMRDHHPKLVNWTQHRSFRLVALAVCFLMLCRIVYHEEFNAVPAINPKYFLLPPSFADKQTPPPEPKIDSRPIYITTLPAKPEEALKTKTKMLSHEMLAFYTQFILDQNWEERNRGNMQNFWLGKNNEFNNQYGARCVSVAQQLRDDGWAGDDLVSECREGIVPIPEIQHLGQTFGVIADRMP
jgi:hypothetical protein